jgi:HSP20 family protein
MLPVLRRNNWLTRSADEPFARLRTEMDTLFDRFFEGDSGFQTAPWTGVPIALWEDDDHLHIEAELPGFSEKDVEVTVHNGMLFIRAERRPEEGRNYLYNSRTFGRVERVVALPSTVDPDHVQARLSGGVLLIELSKSSEAKPKKIAVQAN